MLPAPLPATPTFPFGRRVLSDFVPPRYAVRTRSTTSIDTILLHQMGFEWLVTNPMWCKVRAHYAIHREGLIDELSPIGIRMRYGSGDLNSTCITVEHEGNFPQYYQFGYPRFWNPDRYGKSLIEDHPEQVIASRALLRGLVAANPSIKFVGAHRQISKSRPGCPGPDLWREVGTWAIDVLGLQEMKKLPAGKPIDDSWRGPRRIDG